MTGADFLRFDDGYVYTKANGTKRLYAWNDVETRDMGTGQNAYKFNPDRADNGSLYTNEATSGGMLSEVFGSFGGYKNMSYILDGEETCSMYYTDLYFDGFTLSGDDDQATIEVALLERGGNSKMKVYGILAADTSDPDTSIYSDYTPTLTDGLLVKYNVGTFNPLWKLNTLEIGGNQKVRGYGISISSDWTNLVGLRIASKGNCYKGPDLVAVGVVPEPATLGLLLSGGICVLIRRRRK
ncbi:MAG: PEP-CTERM sorting domain-containing protein [Phycisphaerae bacterium]|nr:PEP-CTERM sorting domain-containing protein [Phycisphaerae bacterium]